MSIITQLKKNKGVTLRPQLRSMQITMKSWALQPPQQSKALIPLIFPPSPWITGVWVKDRQGPMVTLIGKGMKPGCHEWLHCYKRVFNKYIRCAYSWLLL